MKGGEICAFGITTAKQLIIPSFVFLYLLLKFKQNQNKEGK